jgi:undecaprenyl-phosphate glucose phosphotransferase
MSNSGIIRPFDHQLGLLQRVVDAGLIIVCLVACYWAYHGTLAWSDKYTVAAISAVALFYVAAKVNNLYQSYRVEGIFGEVRPLLSAWLLTISGLLLLGYAFKVTHELSRVVLGMWAASTPLLMLAWRHVIRSGLKRLRLAGRNSRSAVIVGVSDSGKALARNILDMPWMGLTLEGFISRNHTGRVALGSGDGEETTGDILGNLDVLFEMARANQIDVVYVAIPTHERDAINQILGTLGNSTVSIYLVPDFYTAEIMQGSWITVGDTPTVSVIDNATQGMDTGLKKLEDLVLASFAVIILAIPMAFIALGVKLGSPGPVLYKQRRYGISGKSIMVWKFRSMTVSESDAEFVQARKDDARITPFGRFLRKTSLDELPQFFNVLAGEMSVVGPRPHAAAHNEQFREKVNGYMLRHKAKPGITGLAQVNGLRGETDTDDKMKKRVHFDMEYINNWSLWMDLAIVAKTPFVLVKNDNAY